MSASPTPLEQLMATVEDRKRAMPEGSYTTQLFAAGASRIGEKILEEAREVVEAAGESGHQGQAHLVAETSDLVYHLLVMLAFRDVGLAEVNAELARRFAVSGLDEKAARQPRPAPKN